MKSFAQIRVPLFLLWFIVSFAAICLIPWHPSKTGKLLPLATPYVNQGLADRGIQVMFGLHIFTSLVVASVIEALRRMAKAVATLEHFQLHPGIAYPACR